MSSSRKSKRVQKFGELLKAPFRRNKSRSPSPSPIPTQSASSNTPTNPPNTTLLNATTSVATSSSALTGPVSTGGQSSNLQSPTISVPVKNEAFQKALQEYIDALSDDDKVAFQSSTDVIEKLGELQQDKSRISSSHPTLVQKVHKVLQCMQLFMGSIAICIQHHPEISSLVVGGLNCILTVSNYLLIS